MIWVAVAFFLVTFVGSAAYAGIRAWRLWQTARRLSRAARDSLERVSASAAKAEARALGLSGGGERLATATASLQAALAEFAAIRAAAAEPRALLAGLRGSVPRK